MRLLRGDMNRATVYGADPAATARSFANDGAALIHIVDLDGAIAGAPRNLEALRAIRAAVRCRIDVSGGLRTIGSIRAAIAAGADFVSIGSAAFLDPGLIRQACEEFPGRIFGSLDLRGGKLAIRGWVETSDLDLAAAAARFRTAGVAALIVTDIARDGAETGANLELFGAVAQLAGVPIIASGGIATLADLSALAWLYSRGVAGAISGRAIYESRFGLAEAIALCANSL